MPHAHATHRTMATLGRAAWTLGVLLLTLVAWRAHAQPAPEGNAHPAQRQVADQTGGHTHPFGEGEARAHDPAELEAFASRVDLSALRAVPAFHNGRVKVLDTLAREAVRSITGRARHVDFVSVEGRDKPRKVSFDPLYTLLDMTINPGSYTERPLIFVNYLPLREAYLERAFPDDPATRERWKRLTRISPRTAFEHARAIADAHADSSAYLHAIGEVEASLDLFAFGGSNFLLIAPASPDRPWLHISTLDESSPARRAAVRLGDAWRAHDAGGVNQAVTELASELQSLAPGAYPAGRLELAYNRLNAFEWGYWVYFLSLLTLILGFGTSRRGLMGAGVALLAAAIALHTTGFVMRCLIAERFAIQNQFESMTGLSLFAAVVGAGIMIARRQWLFGAAAAATGFLALIVATQTGIPGRNVAREAAILNTSVLLKYHVTTVLVSYGLITLGFVASVFYLAVHYLAARAPATGVVAAAALNEGDAGAASPGAVPGRARLLADLDTAQITVLQLAFWTLGVGILLGAWWADHSWGRWWAFDPKETWALITWIVYLIVIHLRFTSGHNRALTTAWLSLVGFAVMLFTYFGVNLLLPGLHAYA